MHYTSRDRSRDLIELYKILPSSLPGYEDMYWPLLREGPEEEMARQIKSVISKLPPSFFQEAVFRLGIFIQFPKEIAHFSSLTSLSMRGIDVDFLPPEIGTLTALTNLDIAFTKIRKLPDEIGDLSSLGRLSAEGTCLSCFPITVKKLLRLSVVTFGSVSLDKTGNVTGSLNIEIIGKLSRGGYTVQKYLNDMNCRHFSRGDHKGAFSWKATDRSLGHGMVVYIKPTPGIPRYPKRQLRSQTEESGLTS